MTQRDPSQFMDRRNFLRRSALLGGLAALGPLHALGIRTASGAPPPPVSGYGPLVNKGDIWLPASFNYQIISRQGKIMSDGAPTPGIFDGMGAFPDLTNTPGRTRTILIRNHENRDVAEEIRVETGAMLEYDSFTAGGNTKLVVERYKTGQIDPETGRDVYTYEVVSDFAILGGTTTNCAGGQLPFKKWVTCEEVVKRSPNGKKHGYIFEVDATSDSPVPAVPVLAAGRLAHEAVAWRGGILYLTEDRSIDSDPVIGSVGACFYRYLPECRPRPSTSLASSGGTLQALKLRGRFHAKMNTSCKLGVPYQVEWVKVENPDHEDDSDNRRDRVPGFTPTRIQAQDKGAACFERLEGAWATGVGSTARIYFDCTTGGVARLGQVWEYNPTRSTITLLYESTNPATLRNPDNMTVVPQTRDVFVCEDTFGEQSIRGLTRQGEIYDFARSSTNQSEFCGACFDRGGHTLYVNQQGYRGELPNGPAGGQAVTYAIYGPFGKRVR